MRMMTIISVAEWCVEALVVSMAFFLCAISAFLMLMISMILMYLWNNSSTKARLDTFINK